MQTRNITNINNAIRTGLAVSILAVFAYATWASSANLLSRLFYELTGPYTADSPIYWAVGRGILNGLTPYRDLFETKPPGIFLISSLSLWLSGTMQFGAWTQTALLAVIPLSVMAAAWKQMKGHAGLARWMIAGGALLFGTTLALYVAERSGEYQVESFGVAFAIAYAGLLAASRGTVSRQRMIMASILILLSVGMKEPFLLSCLSIAILLCENRRAFVRGFLIPSVIAAGAGMVILRLIGMWDGYFHIYIPEMFSRYGNGGDPLWIRGFGFNLLFRDLQGFSPMLAYGIFGIAIAQVIIGFRIHNITRGLWNLITVFCVLYLAALAVGTGNTYYNHHFVFAVGSFAALFIALIRDAVRQWGQSGFTRTITMVALMLLVPTIQHDPIVDYKAQAAFYSNDREAAQSVADQIDGILDRCGMKRYLFIGGNGGQPYGFTRHSPLGPLFFQFDHLLDDRHEKFREEFMQSLHQARLIVLNNFDLNVLTEDTRTYLKEEFTERPWLCANPVASNEPYTFYYRKPWRVWNLLPE